MLPNLNIHISELKQIANELGATPKEMDKSIRRASNRTNITIRKIVRQGLVKELSLRKASVLKRRLRKLTFGGYNTSGIWVGTNDLSTYDMKGQPVQTSSGVRFRGKEYKGAFLAKFNNSGRKRILRRTGASRYPIEVVKHPIHKEAANFLDGKAFDQLADIFLNHFEKDLKSRVKWLN